MAGNSSERLEDLQYKREQARLGGGLKRQEAIRASGRGTARDRVRMLLDEDSFIELDSFVTHRTTDNGMFLHHTLGRVQFPRAIRAGPGAQPAPDAPVLIDQHNAVLGTLV